MVSPFDLTDQVALVIGGAGGLGRVAADALTAHGATVEVADLAGEIDVDSFVSHKLTLDDVNRGFELMEAQDGIRSVIDFA